MSKPGTILQVDVVISTNIVSFIVGNKQPGNGDAIIHHIHNVYNGLTKSNTYLVYDEAENLLYSIQNCPVMVHHDKVR